VYSRTVNLSREQIAKILLLVVVRLRTAKIEDSFEVARMEGSAPLG